MSVRYIEDVVARDNSSAFWLIGAEIDFAYARLYYRAGTHGAWLERHIHVAVFKTPVAELSACFIYCKHFGMCCCAFLCQSQIVRSDEYFAVFYDYAADGTFAKGICFGGLLNCFTHKSVIIVCYIYCH